MVVYYDENDLVSFGNYMLSEARKKSITENPEITNSPTRKMLLQAVTNFDMGNWHRLRVEAERQMEQREAEDQNPQEDMFSGELPTDEEGNTVQLNPENWVDATKSEEE
jgi:hypothetical protein